MLINMEMLDLDRESVLQKWVLPPICFPADIKMEKRKQAQDTHRKIMESKGESWQSVGGRLATDWNAGNFPSLVIARTMVQPEQQLIF